MSNSRTDIKKNFFFYTFVMIGFIGLSWFIIYQGQQLEVNQDSKFKASELAIQHPEKIPQSLTSGIVNNFYEALQHSFKEPLSLLLLQIIIIILTARVFAFLMKKIRQPAVIGEIIAGIILGPSLVGFFFPEVTAFIFPAHSLGSLKMLSQIGLILFMFIVGMELDLNILKNKAQAALVISHSSIVVPYFLGIVSAFFLYQEFAPENVSFISFALFMGIAMSITAFPVLARIVQERGLFKKPIGSMVITCAAADDITAWCILAAVIAIVKAGTAVNALFTLLTAGIVVSLMLFVVRPILRKVGEIYATRETMTRPTVVLMFVILLISAYLCEIIGIHALFGAFLAGTIMPQNLSFKKIMTEKIEDLSMIVLLPLFFVFTGLRTQVGLLNTSHLWLVCGGIVLIAVVGKFFGSSLAALFVGQGKKESMMIGALMNTRGLMELVVLNIGMDLGILSPEIFTCMVIMALVTTFMTGPAMDLIEYLFRNQKASLQQTEDQNFFKILISFGPGKMGATLLELASLFVEKSEEIAQVTALHITPEAYLKPAEALEYEKESFAPIKRTAQELGLKIVTKYRTGAEIARIILNISQRSHYNLLLTGAAKSVFDKETTGGVVKQVMDEANCSVGILIEKGFVRPSVVVLIIHHEDDYKTLFPLYKTIKLPRTAIKIYFTGNLSADLYKRVESTMSGSGMFELEDLKEMNTDALVLMTLKFRNSEFHHQMGNLLSENSILVIK